MLPVVLPRFLTSVRSYSCQLQSSSVVTSWSTLNSLVKNGNSSKQRVAVVGMTCKDSPTRVIAQNAVNKPRALHKIIIDFIASKW